MNLFIIGNGFDLGHGLPTRYWDFRCFLKDHHENFLKDFEEKYFLWGEELKVFLWNDFEYNLANLQEDILVEQLYQSTDLGLESGNIGIEDTLYYHFENEFKYIERLTIYLKEWIEEVNKGLDDISKKTSLIEVNNRDIFINFNYTTTLESIYKIEEENVLHIHGVINNEDDLVLGHSNLAKIAEFSEKNKYYQNRFDEQSAPIYRILAEYCSKTYKEVDRYIDQINLLDFELVDKIIIVGHSLGDVDLPYFKVVNELVNRDVKWDVYYYSENEAEIFRKKLVQIGIAEHKFSFIQCDVFYDQHPIEQT